MNVLFLGDIVGRSGRSAVLSRLADLRAAMALDFVVANGENAAAGFGITQPICDELFAAGVDVITSGNHIWDKREIIAHMEAEARLLRPLNYPARTPGRGAGVFAAPRGRKVLVINVMCQVFMGPIDDPFAAVEGALARHRLGQSVDAVIVDVHGEASSEKMGMGHLLDGRVSLVVGTHTHVPTADTQVLAGGTAYQTDAGMCGDYDSIIGMDKRVPLERFVRKLPTERMEPAHGEGTLCGVYLETDEASGHVRRAAPVRLGGRLQPHWPSWLDRPASL